MPLVYYTLSRDSVYRRPESGEYITEYLDWGTGGWTTGFETRCFTSNRVKAKIEFNKTQGSRLELREFELKAR